MDQRCPTGYGPRTRLLFDGDESKYELWEVKFLGHMRLQKLDEVIAPAQDGAEEPEAGKNKDAYAELVQCLDDKSLSLVIREAHNDGRKALKVLREHYVGQSKPRVIALYNELTTLLMKDSEDVTDYIIRAESAATSLKAAGEVISDSLLIAMMLKGLPPQFRTFVAVITQREKQQTFSNFKVALKSYEETDKCGQQRENVPVQDGVMKVTQSQNFSNRERARQFPSQTGTKCYRCGKMGHKIADCWAKPKKWCDVCKSTTHVTKECRRKDAVKSSNDENEHSFCFALSHDNFCNSVTKQHSLLVDCGATTHIVNDKAKFVEF
ncbi:uncharacterized protein LOC102800653 [Saccoglossus kowalevskii]|uniref:Uncharacterized protein LOC102800653 n=1 Tax=Saccoglossus kowalevskii TaxID=10224 RepID=A0ABM0N1J4_SACKO|nr:PREDICTED: uncharacterized protein LOC102800653 [Saccoglossus kowalevskii]